MAKIKLGIVGLGLIGSSILKGISKNSDYEIFCCSNSSSKKALEYCQNADSNIDILKNCDIIFVCSSASETLNYLNKLNSILNENAIVTDVCSIKKDLLNKTFNFNFILSHPMAGSEKQGFDAGDANLFSQAKWLIQKENSLLNKVILDLKAIPLVVDMSNHDKMCAEISHFPTILSFLLFNSVSDEAKKIASSGFRDMTRLSMTNVDLTNAMLNGNLENIEIMIDKIKAEFSKLKTLSEAEKTALFEKISKQREKMYNKDGKNVFNI